jgi:hypothetical protein
MGGGGSGGEALGGTGGTGGAGGAEANQVPLADVFTPTTDVIRGAVVPLDGNGSSDPEGAELTYTWSLVASPAQSMAELTDPLEPIARLLPDVEGEYEVQLVVNDGELDSAPESIVLSAVRPAPTITITSPESNEVFGTATVDVTGGVDDPDATIVVNGQPVTNDGGDWGTSVALQEGANQITVIATNDTGEGSAEVMVIINTEDAPVVIITSHDDPFIEGPALGGSPGQDLMHTFTVRGIVKVNTFKLIPGANIPVVMINGEPADFVTRLSLLGCIAQPPLSLSLCYVFTGQVTTPLNQPLDITVTAADANGLESSASVSGYIDYCIRGGSDGFAYYQADAGGQQNNRCHEIDGCSLYAGEDDQITGSFRNDPAAGLIDFFTLTGQQQNAVSTAFGSGNAPPEEFYIHGNRPARTLPCNLHDQCYQTAGSVQDVCDFVEMYIGTSAVCARAYPAECPYEGLEVVFCPDWLIEKALCYDAVFIYYLGDVAAGAGAHAERQAEYTHSL